MKADKALPAFHCAARRYRTILARTGGDREAAATRLWQRSRHDTAPRADLLKTACLVFARDPSGENDAPARREFVLC